MRYFTPFWAALFVFALSCEEAAPPASGDPDHDRVVRVDEDGDGIDDAWERDHGLDPTRNDAAEDLDGDGIPNGAEFAGGTLPDDIDSDDDGLADGEEDANRNGMVDPGETSPALFDSDGDGVSDGTELGRTSPLPSPRAGIEGTNPDQFVGDADPLSTTDPTLADTDGDGLPDGIEDLDHNGRVDEHESNPLDLDSDDDGLSDGDEDLNHDGVVGPDETDPTLADTDGDGLPDGLESGVTTPIADPDGDGPLRGTDTRIFVPDSDPSTTTDPTDADTDDDRVPDGDEDWNHDGRYDPTNELNPLVRDTNGDGIPDVDEGIAVVCARSALGTLRAHRLASADLLVGLGPEYSNVSVLRDSNGTGIGFMFEDPTRGIVGFAVSRAPEGTGSAASEKQAFRAGLAQVVTMSNDQDRAFRTWDGFDSVITTAQVFAGGAPQDVARRIAEVAAGRVALSGALPSGNVAPYSFEMHFSTIVRTANRSIIVGALAPSPAPERTLIALADATNATQIAQFFDLFGVGCNGITTQGADMLDLLWVVDDSCSMSENQAAVASIATEMVNLLSSTNLSWRLALTATDQFDGSLTGRGVSGFTPSGPRTLAESASRGWAAAVGNLGIAGSGYEQAASVGLVAAQGALPASSVEDPRKFRAGASVIVVHMSDEEDYSVKEAAGGHDASCNDNAGKQARINELIEGYMGLVADPTIAGFTTFAITGLQPHPTGNACDFNTGSGDCPGQAQHGRTFVDIAGATGGGTGSICGNVGQIVQSIIRAGAGIASQIELTAPPISSTLRVVIADENGLFTNQPDVPRSQTNGFDYAFELDATTQVVRHKILFYGDARPPAGRKIQVGYRRFVEASPDPEQPGCDCGVGLACDGDTNACFDPGSPPPNEEPCGGGCDSGEYCDVDLGQCRPEMPPKPCGGGCETGEYCDVDLGQCRPSDPCEGQCVPGVEYCDTSGATPICRGSV